MDTRDSRTVTLVLPVPWLGIRHLTEEGVGRWTTERGGAGERRLWGVEELKYHPIIILATARGSTRVNI
ncbi:hypothetical protein EVAR_48671_1 [Eumeta japonica]|uniref:Uncharacterized protein n=1 Tax=Eumeta variegata TaxID=151549 RepID=A0A4C1X970_EUMVA|nr:hypothetical protein EVAR_48671_1 [Eumeta japonica]